MPYAADPAVTRHLARFLYASGGAATESAARSAAGRSGLACPTHVLFNGGVMKATASATGRRRAERLAAAGGLRGARRASRPRGARPRPRRRARRRLLRAGAPRHAASGSAAAHPRSYYVGIESAMPAVPGMPAPLKALCVVPFGMEEGTGRHDRRPSSSGWSSASRPSSGS